MIAAWMLYALAVAVLLGGAATALDHALRLARRPARWAWCFAISASLVLPSVAWLTARVLSATPAPQARAARADAAAGDPGKLRALLAEAQVVVLPKSGWGALDRPLLAHEREHVRARDPRLLLGAALAVSLMPWNVVLWWQLRRLHLAVEIDCDHRVLRRHADIGAYGRVLLETAQHVQPARALPATALSSSTTSLEWRIRTMTVRRPRHAVARALALGTTAAGLALVACEAPRPTALASATRAPLTADALRDTVSLETIRAALEQHSPAVLREATGHEQHVWFLADASGRVVQARREDPKLILANTLDPASTASIEFRQPAPGRLAPDSLMVAWFRLQRASAGRQLRGLAPAAAPRAPSRLHGRQGGA